MDDECDAHLGLTQFENILKTKNQNIYTAPLFEDVLRAKIVSNGTKQYKVITNASRGIYVYIFIVSVKYFNHGYYSMFTKFSIYDSR